MEGTKKLSEWNGEDIVQWITGMNVIGVHADNFKSIKDYDELASLKDDLTAFGLSKHEALILKNRIIALPQSLMEEVPQKTQVRVMSHYAVAK